MIADIIGYFHVLIRGFIILVPFFGDEYLLTLHLIIIPFIMLHWVTNQTVCALTEIEKLLRGCDSEEAFFGQLFEPIYKNESWIGQVIKPFYEIQNKDEEKTAVWGALIGLWFITLVRLLPTEFRHLRSDFDRVLALFTLRQTPPP